MARPRKRGHEKRQSAGSSMYGILTAISIVLLSLYWNVTPKSYNNNVISRMPKIPYRRWQVPCSTDYRPFIKHCHKKKQCGRVLMDDFLTTEQVIKLREIADKGMQGRADTGGPTIMDINSGYIKDGDGLVNIYETSQPFTSAEFELYKQVIEKIRTRIMKEFQLQFLYFTAPTFLTRLIGNESWYPKDVHDEYWHVHVDKDNTPHYDYSGLIYLADYDTEFTGGLFSFHDAGKQIFIEPQRGRFLTFTAGQENRHQAHQVTTGSRYLMSFWFTCDKRYDFEHFLDGRIHTTQYKS